VAIIHLPESGAEPAGPSNSSWKRYGDVWAVGGAAGGDAGSALASGSGSAAAIAPIPVIIIKLRRFNSGTGKTIR
jgi:hypothetical protein